ncbi:MAG: glycosyltransferase family 39 protein [Lachnospiraceae bacterium]|jgi:hypothetical protein|nr:glycosyltransferase family 39 protein [Lachnospiraceae bacterium]
MTNKLTTKKLVWLLIAVNIFHLALWTYIGAQKVDYHIDEYLTFGQANNYRAFAYTFTNGEVYPVDIIDAWRAVDSNHSFDFAIPFNSTAFEGDPSNPPFYLMLVHFVYSLVPDYFSNWPALVINFVALTLTAYSVFFIAREIWADDLAALFVMAVFGTMYGVVNMAVYLRTYCLLMLWAGLLVLWHLREKKNHLFLVLLAVFGGITHYYFFVLLAFTALYYGISLIIAKKWGAIWLYIGSMLIAAGLFLLAYPYAFSDYAYEYGRYAQKSADYVHFLRAISGYARVFFEGICRETPLFVLGLLAIIAAGVFFFIKRRQIPRAQTKQLLFIVVPALLYLLTIAKIAPYYPNILEKYVSIILPSMGIAFWGLLYQSVKITPPDFWAFLGFRRGGAAWLWQR